MDFFTEMKKLEGFTEEQQSEWDNLVEDLNGMAKVLKNHGAVKDIGFENEQSYIFVVILNDEMHWDNTAFEDKLEGLKMTHTFVLGVYSCVLNMVYEAEQAAQKHREKLYKEAQDPAKRLILP